MRIDLSRVRPPRFLVVLGLSLIAMAAAASPSFANSLGGGHLDWGLKESFRNYINGPIAHGEAALSEGATLNEDGTYRFPLSGGSSDEAGTAVEFAGKVRFTGHDSGAGPLLDLTVSGIRVEFDASTGTVYADVVSKSLASGELETFDGVDLAALDLTGVEAIAGEESLSWDAIPAVLTENGAEAFAGFYSAGAEMDPLSVYAEFGTPAGPQLPEQPEPGPQPQPEPQRPAITSPTPIAAASAPVRPRLTTAAAVVAIDDRGVAPVARAACPGTQPCSLRTPKRVRIVIDGKRYGAKVIAPRAIGAGRAAQVRVKLPAAAIKALAGGQVEVKVRIVVRSHSDAVTRVAKRLAKVKVKAG
jgi:hypothetical protein